MAVCGNVYCVSAVDEDSGFLALEYVVCLCKRLVSVINMYRDNFCVLMSEGMSVAVNFMLSLISVMNPPPALCNLSVLTVVKLCTLGVFALCFPSSSKSAVVLPLINKPGLDPLI